MKSHHPWRVVIVLSIAAMTGLAGAASAPPATPATQPAVQASQPTAASPARIDFTRETLDNGLRVIYAPLHQAPVVHVRVLYHVGSRDERPDRQGFAHMFEHMMFRGSAHVKPEEHMKLIGIVGGRSNAFTSFDTTQYVNTVPANQLELALYLEADRMASFKVDDTIFRTERKVVAEEWRIRQNQPYGKAAEDFFKLAFVNHPYRWTPIGNMDHLAAAKAPELQAFFDRYYVPNNAVLAIAGDIDVEAARAMVRRYFDWIPRGQPLDRDIPAEPSQTEPRRSEVAYPAAAVPMIEQGYRTPGYGAPDEYPLSLLATILGQGESSRLYRALVSGEDPLCVGIQASHMELEDHGTLTIRAMALAGTDPADIEKTIQSVLAEVRDNGVTQEELDKAKALHRVQLIHDRETAEDLTSQLGEEAVLTGDPDRVNTALDRLQAVTCKDVQAAARRYLQPANSAILCIKPTDKVAAAAVLKEDKSAATQPTSPQLPATGSSSASVPATHSVPSEVEGSSARVSSAVPQHSVLSTQDSSSSAATGSLSARAPATRLVRTVVFPDGYRATPPLSDSVIAAKFAKGTETTIDGVRVIVMPDHRLPLVFWDLTIRRGSHCEPAGREGLGGLAAALVTRGAGGLSYARFSEDLESRGIKIAVADHGDFTRLSGSCTSDQVDHGILRSRQVLLEPALPPDELAKLKAQTISGLRISLEEPGTVADQDLREALFGTGPLGRHATPESVAAIGLDDVKAYLKRVCRPDQAFLIVSGDVTVERGRQLARQLMDGWKGADLPDVDYSLPVAPETRTIILVDRPSGQQSKVAMGIRAYTCHSDERYAGAVAGRILSSGIESRLNKFIRAQKGLAYGVGGSFVPGRQAGLFQAGTDTSLPTSAEAIRSMFQVFAGMCDADVTPDELRDAKSRVVGGMVMGLQTIDQQASLPRRRHPERLPRRLLRHLPSQDRRRHRRPGPQRHETLRPGRPDGPGGRRPSAAGQGAGSRSSAPSRYCRCRPSGTSRSPPARPPRTSRPRPFARQRDKRRASGAMALRRCRTMSGAGPVDVASCAADQGRAGCLRCLQACCLK